MNTRKKTVLLVDDDMDFRIQQRVLLEGMGFTVVEAENRAAADRLIKTLVPDLALVDLMMDHPDCGFVLCHKLKRQFPSMPVVIITAVVGETGIPFAASTREERGWIKADALLSKPVRPEQLRREIERVMEKQAK